MGNEAATTESAAPTRESAGAATESAAATTDDAVQPQRIMLASCSFCGKPNTEVAALVAGPGVYICSECVALAQLVIDARDATAAPVPQIAPWQQSNDVNAVLENLPRIARAGELVEETLAGWVGRGRELGATWARIGAALGMTRQSAWARFSGEE
jgi:hypothetical protein